MNGINQKPDKNFNNKLLYTIVIFIMSIVLMYCCYIWGVNLKNPFFTVSATGKNTESKKNSEPPKQNVVDTIQAIKKSDTSIVRKPELPTGHVNKKTAGEVITNHSNEPFKRNEIETKKQYSTSILNSESDIYHLLDTIKIDNLQKYIIEKWNYNDLCTLIWKYVSGIPIFNEKNWKYSDLVNSPEKFKSFFHANTKAEVFIILDKIIEIKKNPELYPNQVPK